ncbi:MAG TPA: Tex family protein [bacterium]|nr:Tex family protein [bacterium]
MLTLDQTIKLVAGELSLPAAQVKNTLALFDEGCTIPFIARYRKEQTGSLDEVQIRDIRDRAAYLKELDERRDTVLKSIEEQGKLTDGLRAKILACTVKQELEDLYLPYKPKRKTKGMLAKERGLEPLALRLWEQQEDVSPELAAAAYVNAEAGVPDVAAALDGVRFIIAELVSDDAEVRKHIRTRTLAAGVFVSEVLPKHKEAKTKFNQYYEFKEPLKVIPSHRYLAILRGEHEEILQARVAAPDEEIIAWLEKRFIRDAKLAQAVWLREVLKFAYSTYLQLSIAVEARVAVKERADIEAINVFAENARQLLLAPPAGARTTMGIDPGLRTGCKLVVVDATGKLLADTVIYPHEPKRDAAGAERTIVALAKQHQVDLVAIGNGTASRETEQLARGIAQRHPELKLTVVVVSEAGASVYSASDLARLEFPDKDVTVRGAVSIARRLQDPLAELVKIDPKSIGVGQYQHDVNQVKLRSSLWETVESCVNFVGVDLNTASWALLAYVSGISEAQAKNIVAHRDQEGAFKNRRQLLKVARFGPKAFEQAAGFLRIRNGEQPLDNSAVHPERYAIVERIAADQGVDVAHLIGNETLLASIKWPKYADAEVGLPTLMDIAAELKKPGRDPRDQFEAMQFKEGVTELEHLSAGMVLDGVVTNVANFGAFVDVGVHQDGLVHVSQLAKKFVKDPREVVKVGQRVKVKVLEVDLDRKRISLSIKQAA